MTQSRRVSQLNRHFLCASAAALLAVSGCSNAGEGALTGAGVGALSGLAIGSLSGDAGKGAAIGAIVGGVGGAVIGDQNRRRDEAAAKAAAEQNAAASVATARPQTVAVSQPQPAVVVVTHQNQKQQDYSAGSALGRLVGQWRIKGTIYGGDAGPLNVEGTANSSADKTYFVRIDLQFNDPRTGQPVSGTSLISQTGGRGLEMINVFSSSPQVRRFRGELDSSGTVLDLSQVEPTVDKSRRVVMRTDSGSGFAAEVWQGEQRLEHYEFVPR